MAQVVLIGLGVYGLIGLVFGILFGVRGAGVVDPVARAATLRVRALFVPGAAALWPMLLRRWVRAGARTADRQGGVPAEGER